MCYVLYVAHYNSLFIVIFAIALINSCMGRHVRGSICLAISGTRAVVIKIQLDLIWGTMATREGKMSVQQGLSGSWGVGDYCSLDKSPGPTCNHSHLRSIQIHLSPEVMALDCGSRSIQREPTQKETHAWTQLGFCSHRLFQPAVTCSHLLASLDRWRTDVHVTRRSNSLVVQLAVQSALSRL